MQSASKSCKNTNQATTWSAKDRLKFAKFIKDLNAMVECISHDNILVHSQTESMW